MKTTQKTLNDLHPAEVARAYFEAHSNSNPKNKDGKGTRPNGINLINQTHWWNNFALETRNWIDTLPVR